ncbi:plasmid pRiA4b ORF-3 family protein [Pseudarthrobacter sp. NamE2]|uniref:plasmid pRiA4b ORF-3 family protein n=1 Tax=Pseudarthrobacter sp. NamE2 TaxID=2576838 RepID=UPI001F10A273|nr:plasmid pRiA4b ORF-3 family protein [Pseudarthrobacter sp. NamE2]
MENGNAAMGAKPESMLEVRVELVDSEPKIWRQLEVRGSLTLDQVHQVLQAAFGWEDMHLHRFTADDPFAPLRPVNGEVPEALQWLPRRECDEPGERPEEDFSLEQLLALGAGAAFYEYDFGDNWLHRLELVTQSPANEGTPPASVIDGARRGPLEDSGGFPGYEEILEALADPAHPDHAEYSEWVAEITGSAEPFDPAFLDIPALNQALIAQVQVRE